MYPTHWTPPEFASRQNDLLGQKALTFEKTRASPEASWPHRRQSRNPRSRHRRCSTTRPPAHARNFMGPEKACNMTRQNAFSKKVIGTRLWCTWSGRVLWSRGININGGLLGIHKLSTTSRDASDQQQQQNTGWFFARRTPERQDSTHDYPLLFPFFPTQKGCDRRSTELSKPLENFSSRGL